MCKTHFEFLNFLFQVSAASNPITLVRFDLNRYNLRRVYNKLSHSFIWKVVREGSGIIVGILGDDDDDSGMVFGEGSPSPAAPSGPQ